MRAEARLADDVPMPPHPTPTTQQPTVARPTVARLETLPPVGSGGVRVRRAGAPDAVALVRLRAVMLREMGIDVGGDDAPWRRAAEAWFTDQLLGTPTFAAFVVDEPDLGVVSNAMGVCDQHAPAPTNPRGLFGHVFNVATDPRRRRLGYARDCMTALLTWFQWETEARVINLNATSEGLGLYRSLGFDAPHHQALRLRLPDPPT